jgi:hypothetical protein
VVLAPTRLVTVEDAAVPNSLPPGATNAVGVARAFLPKGEVVFVAGVPERGFWLVDVNAVVVVLPKTDPKGCVDSPKSDDIGVDVGTVVVDSKTPSANT